MAGLWQHNPAFVVIWEFIVLLSMSPTKSISEVVREFAARYKPELASYFIGRIHLILTGNEPYTCTLNLSETGCDIIEGLEGSPDCQIKTKSEAFRRIVSNESSPQQEFIMGNIYISNVQVIQLIGKAFR
jgi:hypothetical protein